MNYKIAKVALQGSGHRQNNIPCQDKTAGVKTEDFACAVLADGAGSRLYSDIGAQAAADAACVYLAGCQTFDDFDGSAFLSEITRTLNAVDYPFSELSSTLLLVAVRQNSVLLGHLGDGLIVGIHNGEAEVLSEAENGAQKNVTFFTTDADAEAHFRYRIMPLPSQDDYTFLLMSDGGADCLYNRAENSVAKAAIRFAEWLEDNSESEVEEAIAYNLSMIVDGLTPDDVSVALIRAEQESAAQ